MSAPYHWIAYAVNTVRGTKELVCVVTADNYAEAKADSAEYKAKGFETHVFCGEKEV